MEQVETERKTDLPREVDLEAGRWPTFSTRTCCPRLGGSVRIRATGAPARLRAEHRRDPAGHREAAAPGRPSAGGRLRQLAGRGHRAVRA